jgi:HTH-type transcriptional regulator, sugar sensing transcriptional regulator
MLLHLCSSMKNLLEILQNIGLTKNEARVYLFLLEYKESKTGPICSKLDIRSSHIYGILDKLTNKGLVSYKIINNIKVFRSINPKSLFGLIREKETQIKEEEKDIKKFISTLKSSKIDNQKENDFKYFEGLNGIKSMLNEFIESWELDSKVYIASAPIAYDKWNAFLLEYFHKPRIKKKVSQQLIVPKSIKEHGKEREKLKYLEIKYSEIEQETEFGVAGNYVYFLSQGEKPYALLIKDENLAKTQIKIFEVLWKTSKK